MSVYAWLHRRGIARVLNSSSESMSNRGGAYVEARGPQRAARRLALYALRRNPLCRPDWQTVRVVKTEQPGRMRWRFQFAYRRLGRT